MLTTEQAARRLGLSRATFYNRLKRYPNIKPINYNPNLTRQPSPEWDINDIDKMGVAVHPEETGRVVSA